MGFGRIQLILAAMVMFSSAQRAGANGFLDRAQRRILQINSSFKTQKAKEWPAYRCFQLGQMQGIADRTLVEANLLEKRPENAAKVLELKSTHASMQNHVSSFNDLLSCDSQLAQRLEQLNPTGVGILDQVELAILSTKTISAQDQIVGCFLFGRLSMLASDLDWAITSRRRAGGAVSSKAIKLRDMARAKALKEMPDCKARPAFSNY